mgnify:CR=1 FL=1
MAVKQFTPQITGNKPVDENFKQIREIIDAIIQEINKIKAGDKK